MRMNEIANAEEQLGLLRIIIDNTWQAVKQQADAEVRQRASQPKPINVKSLPKAKPAPMAAPPKPLPKPKPLQPLSVKPEPQQHLLLKQIHTKLTNPKPDQKNKVNFSYKKDSGNNDSYL